MQKTFEEIQQLQAATILQMSCNLWKEERYHRITASNCGKIYKQRIATSGAATVKNLLYSTFSGGAATNWRNTHKQIAIHEFKEKYNISVTSAGLVVDLDHGFLAASPDGFVGSNALIEIKCPYSIRDTSPRNAIINKKNCRTVILVMRRYS